VEDSVLMGREEGEIFEDSFVCYEIECAKNRILLRKKEGNLYYIQKKLSISTHFWVEIFF